MGKNTLDLTDRVYDYLLDVSLRETEVQKALREETDKLEFSMMQISADQGQFMSLLVRMLQAQKIIEVGTFTGYSALCMAMALPANGTLIACDTSEEWTAIGKRYWQQAGVLDKIDLRLAPALDTLQSLIDKGNAGSFDFAFIDADKGNYEYYYNLCLDLIRPGGVIAIDNVLWGGSVADPSNQEDDTNSIRHLNRYVQGDDRVDISMVPIGDGVTLARKKSTA